MPVTLSQLPLRPYQIEGVTFLSERGRAILADDMGLGKTLQALAASASTDSKSFLVITRKVSIGVWVNEIKQWLGEEACAYIGPSSQRRRRWQEFTASPTVRWLVTTYAQMAEIASLCPYWDTLIFDESHILRNRKSKTLYRRATLFRSRYLYLLTGSPIMNQIDDLWTSLNLINPAKFSSYWRFVNTWLRTQRGQYGGYEVLGPKDPKALRQFLAQYVLRRTKGEVLPDLPPKIRQAIPIEMEPSQRVLYDQMADTMLATWEQEGGGDERGFILAPNQMAKVTRLRQILVTPALIGACPSNSGVLSALAEQLNVEWEAGNPVVIFTPFRKAFPYILEACVQSKCKHVFALSGGLPQQRITEIVDAYQRSTEPRRAMVCTIGMGTGFTLTRARVAIFVGYDWVPDHNYQAEDRLHRLGQTDSVRALYFVHRGTIDDHVMAVLDKKTTWRNLLSDPTTMLKGRR